MIRGALRDRLRQAFADALTRKLTDEAARVLGRPTRDGWSLQYDPATRTTMLWWSKGL